MIQAFPQNPLRGGMPTSAAIKTNMLKATPGLVVKRPL
jgi:hypothetical protein